MLGKQRSHLGQASCPFSEDLLCLPMVDFFIFSKLAKWEICRIKRMKISLCHLFVEQRHVERFEGFVVVGAFRRARRVAAVLEIVVERDGDGFEAVDAQLDAQALGERRLAGRRRPRDEDEAQLAFALGDVVGDFGDLLFLQGFGNADDVADLAISAGEIGRAHV